MAKKYDTVLFDLDGTLLDTLGDLTDSLNFALATEGFPARTPGEVRRFIGDGVEKLVARAVPEGIDAEKRARTLDVFKRYYLKNSENKTRPYDGIPELLRALRDAGRRLAVISNKVDAAVAPLCKAYFGDIFSATLGNRESVARKPAPDAVFAVMRELGATPEKTVYIGDSDVDILTARNAGIDGISVSWGFRDRAFLQEFSPMAIADRPSELAALLGVG